MQLGDTIETAIWLDGRETKAQRSAYEREVTEAIDMECSTNGFLHGEIKFHVKHPYDDRVPEVPEHIEGTQPRLLVAEADIVAKKFETTSTFVSTLETKDLLKLRKITKAGYLKNGHVLNDHQSDQVIEMLGPDTIHDIITRGVN
jgi:hypothetical protein